MTTWQIVALVVGSLFAFFFLRVNIRWRESKLKIAREAAELEKSRKLFVCFSGENKDRLELITLMTRACLLYIR